MKFESINPFTEELIGTFDFISDDALNNIINKADNAQKSWANLPIAQRATFFIKLAEIIKQKHEELALLATLEMGKPLAEA